MSNDKVDTLTPPAMAAWLRETAANTRLHGQRPMLTTAEMNVAPHVAFRLEQAADLLERMHNGEFICMECFLRKNAHMDRSEDPKF